jgi:hypothetical protein
VGVCLDLSPEWARESLSWSHRSTKKLYLLNAAQTIPRKKIKRGTALFRDGQRDGPGGQINYLSDRPITMVWERSKEAKRERVQDSSTPRPLLTNVGLSKGVLGVQANKISNLGTNHHRQKQQQVTTRCKLRELVGCRRGTARWTLVKYNAHWRLRCSPALSPVSFEMYGGGRTIEFRTVYLGT